MIRLDTMPPTAALAPIAGNRTALRRYAVALICFGLTLLIRFTLNSIWGITVPYLTFFPAIILSAWYGGLGPGLLATGLSAVAALEVATGPRFLGLTYRTELARLSWFLAAGVVISWLNEEIRRKRTQLESELRARRQSEDALRQSEERYRVMAEAASDGIITINDRSIIQFANSAAARMFGYTLDEILGRSLTMLMPEHLRHVHESSLQRYIKTGEKHLNWQGTELPGLHKNGARIDIEVAFGEYREDGRRAFTGVVRDITERKRFDEQLRHTARLESLGVLAGGVAHDFNNLLTGIMGNASLACDSAPPGSPERQMMCNVVEASERASHLTRQLLAYAGKGRFVVGPLSLSALVREIYNLIRTSIPKGVQLQLDLKEPLPLIAGDSSQLQQLLMNLAINGAEAIPENAEGTVLIRTAVQEVDEAYIRNVLLPENITPGQYVLLEVHDTGTGMDRATMERIFDPFFTTKFTGRGLGLAAVLGIVRGHKGALKVYSTPGRGTIFKALLPISAENRTELPAPARAPVELRMSGEVLVVDDEEVVRKVAKAALEQHGLRVILAGSGAEAIELYRNRAQEIAVIVLDLTMPGMSGEETFRHLKTIEPKAKVILSSGYNEVEIINRFAGKGLAGFIQKPYTATALVEKVAGVLPEQ